MISLEQLTDYCMNFPESTQDFPFDQETMVFKVCGKMFALVNVAWWMNGDERMNVKCEPEYALELRDQYESIKPGYHMSKKHWNTINVNDGELSRKQIFIFIKESYDLVISKLPKKDQERLA